MFDECDSYKKPTNTVKLIDNPSKQQRTIYQNMSFCPIPHTTRDQTWLAIGVATGCAVTYLLSNTTNSKKIIPSLSVKPNSTETYGFVGCGTISTAIITGLCTLPLSQRPSNIIVSPRNKEKAQSLAQTFPKIVSIASSNQEVVDLSNVIFLAVGTKVAKSGAISKLTFTTKHKIVSVMASIPMDVVQTMVHPVPHEQICRAIPLPAVAVHKGATIVSDHPLAKQIFDPLGKAVVARNANELDVLMCISCMMGPYYKTCGVVTEWFVRNGISKETASDLTIAFYHTVLSEAEHRVTTVKGSEAFQELVNEQTPGGLNEKNVIDMNANGAFDAHTTALTNTLKGLRGE